jgi:hypothetical protein
MFGDISAYSLNVFKRSPPATAARSEPNDDLLYERAFGFHDQGHKPSRMGVEVGKRSIVGMEYAHERAHGAVALAQLRKLDGILTTLREKKAKLRASYRVAQRRLSQGQRRSGRVRDASDADVRHACACGKFGEKIGAKPIAYSAGTSITTGAGARQGNGRGRKLPVPLPARPCGAGVPQTHAAADGFQHRRAINISVGVVDKGSVPATASTSNPRMRRSSRWPQPRAAINNLSERRGQCKWRGKDGGRRVRVDQHALYGVVHEREVRDHRAGRMQRYGRRADAGEAERFGIRAMALEEVSRTKASNW